MFQNFRIYSVLVSFFLCSYAYADFAFDGPYVQLGLGLSNNNSQQKFPSGHTKTGNESAFGQVSAGYSYGFNNGFNLSGNVFMNINDSNAGVNWGTNQSHIKDSWGILFEPGYYLTKKTLGYAKLGYQQSTINYSGSSDHTADAFVFGAGLKQIMSSHLYLGIDLKRAEYSTREFSGNSNFLGQKNSDTQGMLTLGYLFNKNNDDYIASHEGGAFDGPYVQVGAGLATNSNNQSSPTNEWSFSDNTVAIQPSIGYSKSFNSLNLAANIHYNFSEKNSGRFSMPGTEIYATKLKNVWGITFEPGFYLSKTTLGFAKIGWDWGDAYATNTASNETVDKNVNGITYGLGLKQLLTEKIYIGAEFSRTEFIKENVNIYWAKTTQTNQTTGLITVGYKF